MRRKKSIECWLIMKTGETSKVVLLRVSETEKYPSFLQPVTGGIKDGESTEGACVREVFEETGISLSFSKLNLLASDFEVVIDKGLTIHKEIFFVIISLDQLSKLRLNPAEHIGYDIVLWEEVDSLLYWQGNKDTWKRLNESLLFSG